MRVPVLWLSQGGQDQLAAPHGGDITAEDNIWALRGQQEQWPELREGPVSIRGAVWLRVSAQAGYKGSFSLAHPVCVCGGGGRGA